jgi:LmbE family N-acetylglucosaminyl deacetylase
MKTNIMIFSPHPDDAEIAIGGFILTQCEKGFGKAIIESNIN